LKFYNSVGFCFARSSLVQVSQSVNSIPFICQYQKLDTQHDGNWKLGHFS